MHVYILLTWFQLLTAGLAKTLLVSLEMRELSQFPAILSQLPGQRTP